MYDGFIKAACGLPVCTVADTDKNTNEIKKLIDLADGKGINLLVLPELCITGYTCGDLFYSDKLKDAAKKALLSLAEYTKGKYPAVTVLYPNELTLFYTKLTCPYSAYRTSWSPP